MISCFSSDCAYLYLLERQHAEQLKSWSFSDLLFPMESRDQNACCSFDLFVLVICAAHQPSPYYYYQRYVKGLYMFFIIFFCHQEKERKGKTNCLIYKNQNKREQIQNFKIFVK